MYQVTKYNLAKIAFQIFPQLRFERTTFLLGHMRCGSSVLSNVLMANKLISGYGETHVSYKTKYSPALLGISLLRNGINPFKNGLMFDKILHNGHDGYPDCSFYNASAIFLIRHPVETVSSLCFLAKKCNNLHQSFVDPEVCLDYYISRLNNLKCSWNRFPKKNRYMLSYESLLENTEKQLNAISTKIFNNEEIKNKYYVSHSKMGSGDPINMHKFSSIKSIKKNPDAESTKERVLKLESLITAERLYEQFLEYNNR
tara:strand:+ start:5686 stop:6456 length:771 start_codon:yes stop_codon:yes gene_type:complete